MNRKTLGLVLSVVGLLVGLASALADPLGLSQYSGFGSNQWAGTIIGVVVLLVGLVLYSKAQKTG